MRKFRKQIVICGSMSFYSQMNNVRELLLGQNILGIVPSSDVDYEKYYSNTPFEQYKRVITYNYIKKIKQPETQGVLVINTEKYDIPNYIGPNTFAEIVVAITNKKKVYILNNIPDVYFEELNSWGVITFDGDIDKLISNIKSDFLIEYSQPELFEDV